MTDTTHPAAWHPDPSGRYQKRYWDGQKWTEHVANGPAQGVDEAGRDWINSGDMAKHQAQQKTGLVDGEMFGAATQEKIKEQAARAQAGKETISQAMSTTDHVTHTAPPIASGGSSIFNENIIVVNQKAKLLELTNEYSVFNQNGEQIAVVREVGQSSAKKVARALLNVDAMMTHTLDIVDMQGALQLRVTKPRALVKAKVVVEKGDGSVLGELAIKIRIGKAHIKMLVGDQLVGMIYAENFRAWNFRIEDASGTQIASISKSWEGFAKAIFTTADNYVLQIHQPLADPLHSMVLASSLAIDLILKQNDKGLL
jgi:uncharacterized protein YxjI